jgi:hypothetical protein
VDVVPMKKMFIGGRGTNEKYRSLSNFLKNSRQASLVIKKKPGYGYPLFYSCRTLTGRPHKVPPWVPGLPVLTLTADSLRQ